MATTTWGSRPAEDMFKIATRLAGFDARELMLEIHARHDWRRSEKVNERTVLAAMDTLYKKAHDESCTCSTCSRRRQEVK